MHVQPQVSGEQRGGNDQSVRGDDHDIRIERDVLVERRGLKDWDSEPLGDQLGGRCGDAPTAPARRVRAREERDDVVIRSHALEHVGPERRGRGDGQPCHVSR